MSVLNKISKEDRKKLNRCLKDRVEFIMNDYNIPNEKIAGFRFSAVGFYRNYRRIVATLMYSVSKEKIRNKKDFKISVGDFVYTPNDNKVDILFEAISHKNSISCSKFSLMLLVKNTSDKNFALILKFKGGNFEEDESKNIYIR